MLNPKLFKPSGIVVVGGSNDISKPGGKILKNIIDGGFKGKIFVMNLKEEEVQGIKSYKDPAGLPDVDLAVIAIAAKYVPETAEYLMKHKNVKALIVISAGFSEENEEGEKLEEKLVTIVERYEGTLIGPNCIGILTPDHHSIFTEPIPRLDPEGCVLISGSGATACFIMESGIPRGLSFSSVITVGNSAQVGVEEVLRHYDEAYDMDSGTKTILLYIENIDKPGLLLKHASSLIRKGCRIAAIKAGTSEAGSRAASSHTGALATPDVAVDALFKKAGIVRCYGRDELITVASVFMHKKLKGKNIAVISHAGGPAVMLTDALEKGGLSIPHIEGREADNLKEELFPGSSVANPIDFLATGTAEQLGTIIEYTDKKFDIIDGMIVIFGTPGLKKIFDVYEVLNTKMKSCKKPIFPVLPSLTTAKEEVDDFISKGRIFFPDEVMLGRALAQIYKTPQYHKPAEKPLINTEAIRQLIDRNTEGYLSPEENKAILEAAGIPAVLEKQTSSEQKAAEIASEIGFPVVMKVVGPVHKSDVGGVVLNINSQQEVRESFRNIMKIKDASAVLIQKMTSGKELFAGLKREPGFGHLVVCGMGGIYIEVFKDASAALAPVSEEEASDMIRGLKSFKIIEGARGDKGINMDMFIDVILRLSALACHAPEIAEMDINPLIGNQNELIAVDTRIRISG